MKKAAFILLSFVSAILFAQTEITGFNSPESIVTDGEFLYVSNVGVELQPTVKDQDGYISKLDMNGKIIDKTLIKTLNAPKGMAVSNGVLYVADIDHLLGFNLKSKKKVFDVSFEGETSFLNCIELLNEEELFVSATDVNKIFRLNLKTETYEALITDEAMNGPNGILLSNTKDKLYVVGWGRDNERNGSLGIIDIASGSYQSLGGDIAGYLDGLQLLDGKLYFSDWVEFKAEGGDMYVYDMVKKTTEVADGFPLIGGPADFRIINGKFYIPSMIEGKVVIK